MPKRLKKALFYSPFLCFLSFFLICTSCAKSKKPVNAFCDDTSFRGDTTLFYADTTTDNKANDAKNYAKNLQSLFDLRYKNTNFNGAALIAVKGKIVYENYFGIANRATNDTITAHSAFHIASVSKTFTALAVLWLHEHKKMNINDLVIKYLPNFPYPDLTIAMLLKHRSGLSNYSYFAEKAYQDTTVLLTNTGVLHELIRQKIPLQVAPDTHFQYCNTNFAVLALVIEAVTKMPYSEFISCRFFEPLGMKHSFVYEPAKEPTLPKEATRSYIGTRENPLEFDDGVVGDKNIYSTVQDLYRWDRALKTRVIVSDSMLQLAYTAYSNERAGFKNYGLGWRLLVYPNAQKIVYHNGWWHGNTASLYRFLDADFTCIVLANRYNRTVYQMQPIYDILIGQPSNMGFEEE